jgi:hypothetical protein
MTVSTFTSPHTTALSATAGSGSIYVYPKNWSIPGPVLSDNVFLPGYEYEVELKVRDSNFYETSRVGVALFIDDFYGESYYFDFDDYIWKHKDNLISLNRKTSPIYDSRKIYFSKSVSSGEFIKTNMSPVYDPKDKATYYSTNQRKIKFKFHTLNFDVWEPKRKRNFARSKNGLHSLETEYYFRVVKTSNEGSFVSFDDISIRNLTYEKYANNYYYLKEDLISIYDQFDYDRDSLQSRDAEISSEIHEVSGGSRHVYIEPCSWPDLSGTYRGWASFIASNVYEFSDG